MGEYLSADELVGLARAVTRRRPGTYGARIDEMAEDGLPFTQGESGLAIAYPYAILELLVEIRDDLRERPLSAILESKSCFELASDGLPDTPGLKDAISDSLEALGIDRVDGRVAAVTLAVRTYLGGLFDD